MTQTRFFKRNIEIIFIMLGNECNMSCRYCLQHPLMKNKISHGINTDIYDFIEEVACGSADIVNLHFFGGEPLLFKDNIKEIVNVVTEREIPVTWSILTNGKAIDQEYIELFLEHDFGIGVSWDGANTLATRKYDPFADPEKKKLLFSLPKLGVSAVMSTANYPISICEAFQKLSEEYKEIWGHHLMMNVDDIISTGTIPRDLLGMDLERLAEEVKELARTFISVKKLGGAIPNEHYAVYRYIEKHYNNIMPYYMDTNSKKAAEERTICCCGNGYTTINLGIDGKLYHCHNCDITCGSIEDPEEIVDANVRDFDKTADNMKKCRSCIALPYCHGGCKLVSAEERERSYCPLRRTVAAAIQDTLIKGMC